MWRWWLCTCLLAGGLAAVPSEGDPPVFWITFVDKGPTEEGRPVPLSERCLARRLKAQGEAPPGFADWPVYEPYVEAIRPHCVRLRHRSRWLNAVSAEVLPDQVSALARLSFVRSVRRAARVVRAPEPALRAGPPDYGTSDAQLRQIKVDRLHALGYSGQGVLVCLLDTGFYKDHESLRDLPVVAERDFVFGDDDTQRDPANPNDYSDAHGTAVWSALAANRPGVLIGPAYGASFLLAKTEDLRWELPVEEDHWVAAIEWADSAGADVVSSSLAYTTFDDGSGYSFEDLDGNTAVTTIAADRAAALGIAVVVAAGNYRGTSWGHISTPADGDSVIAVGAVDAGGIIAGFSSPGPTWDDRIKPEVCARGVATACALNGSTSSYGWTSGTSLSTPLVAGVAALLLEANPTWRGVDVREALMTTADRAGNPDNDYGWGIVDAFAAAGLGLPFVIGLRADVEDDESGESIGNGNGTVEPGERAELTVVMTNDGTGPTGELTCTVESFAEAVTLVRDAVTVASLAPGDTVRTGTFLFDYAPWGPVATTVPFSLTVASPAETLTVWEFSIPVDRLYAVVGHVVEAGIGTPVPATVRIVREQDAGCDTVLAGGGLVSLWLPEGTYALQARAPGFISPDAAPVCVPCDSSVTLNLARPLLVATPDTIRHEVSADSCAAVSITVANEGTGILRFAAMPVARGGPSRPRDEVVVLRDDPREGGPADLVRLAGSFTGSSLIIRLEATAALLPGRDAVLVALDTDGDSTNGLPACGLLADYAVDWTGGAALHEAAGSRWMPAGALVCSLRDSTLELTVPTDMISPCVSPLRVAVSADQTIPVRRVFDRLPDDGGTDPVVWYLEAPSWMGTTAAENTIGPGSSLTLDLSIAACGLPAGVYRADLLFQGGFAPTLPLPIILTVTSGDSGPAERPASLTVGDPSPNPARDDFRVNIGLPTACEVEVELIDMAGRRLMRRRMGELPAGWTALTVAFPAACPRGASWLRIRTPLGDASRIVVRN